MEDFNPKSFIERQIKEIRELIRDDKAVIAVSGGVDSSTCAVLTHLAIGDNLVCVMLDDAFMREGEPERVAGTLSRPPLSLPMKIERVQERFLDALEGLRDAEEKRKAFRETFYRTLGEIAKREGSKYLVQGTILADIIETKGGIKTQHNVLEQIGISTRELYGFRVVEPLVTLLKWQVREVARHLKASLKRATTITEEKLSVHKPSQYFVAIVDNVQKRPQPNLKKIEQTTASLLAVEAEGVSAKVFADKATGMKDEARKYGGILALTCRLDGDVCQPSLEDLGGLQEKIIEENTSVTRLLYAIAEKKEMQPYVMAVRAVETRDFLTARVADIPWPTLKETADRILEECPNVSTVYYDVTPKPPATVEME